MTAEDENAGTHGELPVSYISQHVLIYATLFIRPDHSAALFSAALLLSRLHVKSTY